MIDKIFIYIFFFSISNVMGQLEVNSINETQSALENLIVSELFGCNIQISNIEYTGNEEAIGGFTYTSNAMCSGEFGLDRGLIMTTGMIDYAVGPNNNGDDGEEWNIEYEDTFFHNYLIDHDVITPSVNLFDACVLEFDISSSTFVSSEFEVIFGSEEYTEWMSPFYADAFAFFVTEIDADLDPYFDSNPKNIMETGDILNSVVYDCDIENKPISAWTIRPYSTVFNMPGLNECLYIDNENGDYCDAIGYDGYTRPMLFNLSLQPLANYHIKMVIIDGVSDYWAGLDSGIFIKNTNLESDTNFTESLPLFEYDILGDTIIFNQVNSINPNINYEWDFNGDGIIDSNETNPSYIYESPGIYNVNLEYVDACTGISSSISYEIIINSISSLSYTPAPSVSVFPNPARDNLYVSIQDLNSESSIKILDLSGRIMYENIAHTSFQSINLESIVPGMYHISIENKLNDLHYVQKLIIF
jgi:hypothetical protein